MSELDENKQTEDRIATLETKLRNFGKKSSELKASLDVFIDNLPDYLQLTYTGAFTFHIRTRGFQQVIDDLNDIITTANDEMDMNITKDDSGTLVESKLPLFNVPINKIPVFNREENNMYGFAKKIKDTVDLSYENYHDEIEKLKQKAGKKGGKRRSIRNTKAQRSRKKKLRKRGRTKKH